MEQSHNYRVSRARCGEENVYHQPDKADLCQMQCETHDEDTEDNTSAGQFDREHSTMRLIITHT
ncbi:MAG: hypothetical protein AAGU11_24035, partial [Syntrophobacteraceae bacterium]